MNKAVKFIVAAVLAVVIGIVAYFSIANYQQRRREKSQSEFFALIEDGRGESRPDDWNDEWFGEWKNEIDDTTQILRIHVDGFTVYGYTTEKGGDYAYWATLSMGTNSVPLNEKIRQWETSGMIINISASDPNAGSAWSALYYVGFFILMGVLLFFIYRTANGGGGKIANFGKTKARVTTNIKVRFSDVAGAEEEKEELAEVVEFLKNPKKFSELGAKIPKGVLLVGPPGTGKTLFARAVAGEAGVPFFSASGSDFVEMYVGVGASRVRDLFDLAKRNQPCIIFIDEIDAVGRQRGAGLGGGHDEREQTLNQILVQMDGFETNEGIIVMAATNRADILDSALLRPGRFDRQIYVQLPDVKGREQILKVHARNKPIAPDVNFKTIARITSGFSGADLANLLNEAAILAARSGKSFIGNLELYEGVNKVVMGPQKKSRVVTEADKKSTAYHEAGHAVLAKLLEHCDNVHEVSIIPRGMAAGYTFTRPEADDRSDTVGKLLDDICMSLGGRVAEELVIHDVSAGASGDIQHVTKIARKMVTEWGMSDRVGPIAYGSDTPVFLGRDYEQRNTYSEETAAIIDEEIKAIVSNAYERAKKLLLEHRSILDNMARVLVERETIYTNEVDMLMKGASYSEVLAYMEDHDKNAPDDPFGRYEEGTMSENKVSDAGMTPADTAEKSDETADMGASGRAEPPKEQEEAPSGGAEPSDTDASGKEEGPSSGEPSDK